MTTTTHSPAPRWRARMLDMPDDTSVCSATIIIVMGKMSDTAESASARQLGIADAIATDVWPRRVIIRTTTIAAPSPPTSHGARGSLECSIRTATRSS